MEEIYEQIWNRKLKSRRWLTQDGSGRVENAVRLMRAAGIDISKHRILDVGCGRGAFGRILQKEEGMFGLDIAQTAVTEAAQVYQEAHVMNLDRDPLPFEQESFDRCVMLDVIEHVIDPRTAVHKVHGALRPGGMLLLSTPNILWWRRLWHMIWKRQFPWTGDPEDGYDGGHLHVFTFRDICAILSDAGFVEIENVGDGAGRWLADFRGGTIWAKATRKA